MIQGDIFQAPRVNPDGWHVKEVGPNGPDLVELFLRGTFCGIAAVHPNHPEEWSGSAVNPDTFELSQTFRGTYREVTSAIEAEAKNFRPTRTNPSGPIDSEEARAFFRAFHWGEDSARVDLVPFKRPVDLVELGRLASVTYVTSKGGELAAWKHEFESPPFLCFDRSNGALIVPGVRVTSKGIEG